jgi:expansin (peptidoglycan-binding protein)
MAEITLIAGHRRPLAALALVAAAAGCSGIAPEAAPATTTAPTTSAAVTTTTSTSTPSTTTTTTSTTSTTTTTTTAAPPPVPKAPPPPPAPAPAPAAGPLHSGRATHYDLASLGNCMIPGYPGPDRMFVAMNHTDYGTADLCGAHLSVQGNRGSVTVKVIDQCPECPPGALDLSPDAFARITGDAGITTVQWRVVSGPAQPAISYRIKEGSSQWWVAILAIDHRNPVRSLEALVGGRWVALQRQDYNYFVAEKGLGPGPFDVRLTDTYGERVVSPGLTPDAGRVFATSQQLTGH